jgi:hypothetical protein
MQMALFGVPWEYKIAMERKIRQNYRGRLRPFSAEGGSGPAFTPGWRGG